MMVASICQVIGLDVGDIGHLGVGHDRRRIAVDENDAIALLAQRLARLRARIVELARLPDDDRAGADDEDALDVGALGHFLRGEGRGARGEGAPVSCRCVQALVAACATSC
jgi:hypothetical protein